MGKFRLVVGYHGFEARDFGLEEGLFGAVGVGEGADGGKDFR